MHYALAVGLGAEEPGADELDFVYERRLKMVPSMATVLGFDDSWLDAGGIDLRKVVHGAQHLTFLAPLPPEGAVEVSTRIVGAVDKGPGRGALVIQETRLSDSAGNRPLTVGLSTLFVRGEGGFGGSVGFEPATHQLPSRPPDRVATVSIGRNQALYFRLLGDLNPLHVDPEIARASGFSAPILHGACTYGIACATLLRTACGLDPSRLKQFEARFAGAVYPGETLVFLLWRDDGTWSFRASVAERGGVILDNGRAEIDSGSSA